jgi:hypothetical protein
VASLGALPLNLTDPPQAYPPKFFGLHQRSIQMKKDEARIQDMCVRVHQHGLARAAAFPANSRGHELYAAVDVAIMSMHNHSAAQAMHANAAKEKTALRKVADAALRNLMETISGTARSISRLTPGMEEKFRLPSNRDRRMWVAAARAFAMEAEPLAEEFVGRGMAPDFVDDLKARILAVQQTVDGQAQASDGRVGATAGLGEAARGGLEAVRELSPIVHNIFAGNGAELAAWESASRVARAPQRAQDEEKPTTEPPPAQS